MIGEALVINNESLQQDFPFHMKQRGALLAKGRLLGIQFKTLLEDRLYFRLAEHANHQALQIADAFRKKGFSFLAEPQTNQVFPVLNSEQIDALANGFEFYVWQKVDEQLSAVRLITSWATSPEHVATLIRKIETL